jgi:hypothetical protein
MKSGSGNTGRSAVKAQQESKPLKLSLRHSGQFHPGTPLGLYPSLFATNHFYDIFGSHLWCIDGRK